MNESTPRRYRGSLLERAAEHYHLNTAAPQPVAQPAPEPRVSAPAAPRVAPVAPPPAPVAAPTPAPVAQPVTAPVLQPAPEPVAPPPAPVFEAEDPQGPLLRRGYPNEVPAPSVAMPRDIERRLAPIDRELLAANSMIVPGSAVTPLAEEFRLVKRQLLLTARAIAGADAQRARMILVCSAQPNEGKTFCAINLALSMAAEKDVEILLVDADFAKPDILERLGLPEGPGLLDVLSGSVAHAEQCIIDTDIPQLSVLPAGTKTNMDTELLASDRARAILDGLAEVNPRRIVIFDSPPALAASPAAVLSLQVGQVMLVVRADYTSESDLREATAMLDTCEHIQLVLNNVSYQPGGRRFGTYYGYGETGK